MSWWRLTQLTHGQVLTIFDEELVSMPEKETLPLDILQTPSSLLHHSMNVVSEGRKQSIFDVESYYPSKRSRWYINDSDGNFISTGWEICTLICVEKVLQSWYFYRLWYCIAIVVFYLPLVVCTCISNIMYILAAWHMTCNVIKVVCIRRPTLTLSLWTMIGLIPESLLLHTLLHGMLFLT